MTDHRSLIFIKISGETRDDGRAEEEVQEGVAGRG